MTSSYRKKLIEVALPLEAINAESAREKSIRHGHPSTLHLWWARRPLAACRAVLWSSLVDDPSEYMPDEESANRERERLFAILEDLVQWENSNNEEVLDKARLEIARSVARDLGCDVPVGKQAINEFLATKAPPVMDPFAGGGSIPLEAQRLGLRAYASDLNPVAVLINKAQIELPARFAGLPPVHGTANRLQAEDGQTTPASSAADPTQEEQETKIEIPENLRRKMVELARQFRKTPTPSEERLWQALRNKQLDGVKFRRQQPIGPFVVDFFAPTLRLVVEVDGPIHKQQQEADRQRQQLLEAAGLRVFRLTAEEVENHLPETLQKLHQFLTTLSSSTSSHPSPLVGEGPGVRGSSPLVGQSPDPTSSLPSPLVGQSPDPTSSHPSPLVGQSPDPTSSLPSPLVGQSPDPTSSHPSPLVGEGPGVRGTPHEPGVRGPQAKPLPEAYADAIATYLAFAVDKATDFWSNISTWTSSAEKMRSTFGRQAIPMTWDYAEANPLCDSTGNWMAMINLIGKAIDTTPASVGGTVQQANAQEVSAAAMLSMDPPYYDNIGYADLSDFFYVWLRHALGDIYPDLFSTLLVPKAQELVATPYRFDGDKERAKQFFEQGLQRAFQNFRRIAQPHYPVTVFYAFKQTESEDEEQQPTSSSADRASTGWETMLEGLLQSGFEITGTWPMRTERSGRSISIGTNALASSIVLVCRPLPADAPTITRRDFLAILKRELPPALRQLQKGNIAPVDLAQAAIGPGMAIFSRHARVLEANGSPMSIRSALALINQALDEYLTEQEGEYDADTRWALAWFEQYGHEPGPYGVAETLSKAKNTSVEGLAQAGFLEARAGKVRLLRREELPQDWHPGTDKRLSVWEATQYLIHALDKTGEQGSAALLAELGTAGETARDLAYRLYTVCERKGWATDALSYNTLVIAWPRIKEQVGKIPRQQSFL